MERDLKVFDRIYFLAGKYALFQCNDDMLSGIWCLIACFCYQEFDFFLAFELLSSLPSHFPWGG